ncbi:MAG: MEDS domain-containing protein [Bacteroidales bacterium]|nr:MEDS domain-containing protein [Bacteroidales bacterium]
MKDQNKNSGRESVSKSTYKAEYAEHLWFALVDCLTVDLEHGEATFYTENKIHRDVFREFMAKQGYDVDRARNSAIL